jgi:hypothetical protein
MQSGLDNLSSIKRDNPAERQEQMSHEQPIKTAIKESMSPQGVALAIAHLRAPINAKDDDAATEVAWLVDMLTAVVGGPDAVAALCKEIGA